MDRKPVNAQATRSLSDPEAILLARGNADDLACFVAIVLESLRKLSPERRARLLASATTMSEADIVFEAETKRPPSNILRLDEVLKRTGLTRSTLYVKMSERTFPRQVKMARKCVGWYEDQVNDWLATPS